MTQPNKPQMSQEVANEPETRRDYSNRITLLSSRGNNWFFDRAFFNYHSNQYTTGDVIK